MMILFPLALFALAQPVLELPEDETKTSSTSTATAAAAAPVKVEEPTLLEELRLDGKHTTIGSYGEAALEYLSVGRNGHFVGTATLRRMVLFVSHNFSDRVSGYLEAEWENALSCDGCQGSAEIEQGYVDYKLLGDDVVLRAGLILVPMGIINQWHEPPIYHGVSRPRVDLIVIPSTWRELGVGAHGRFFELGSYELYFFTPLDVVSLAPSGFANARTQGSFSPANGFMVAGRLEVEPLLGGIIGLSMIGGDLGGGDRFFNAAGERKSLFLPIFGVELDARSRRWGFEARAVASAFFFPETSALLKAYRADGSPYFPDPASTGAPATRIVGVYGEVAYDILRLFTETDQQLLPFYRLEFYDTQSAMPDNLPRDAQQRAVETTFGLSYRPLRQVVLKVDYQLRDRGLGLDEKQLNLGAGYMF